MTSLEPRYLLAQTIAFQAGQLALDYFRRRESLLIEKKGLQDQVSAADRETEAFIRRRIREVFPEDGILGEEGGDDSGTARFIWVVDPIDGTSCFVYGVPAWCVSIGILVDGVPMIGVIYDPNTNELFHAMRGAGTYVGAKRCHVADVASLRDGMLGVGYSHRVTTDKFLPFLEKILECGGIFIRSGSGALMIAHVAAGRLIGYYEPHLNAWDCLAGIVLVEEAGGVTNMFLADNGLSRGNPILVSSPKIYDELAKATGVTARSISKSPRVNPTVS